jgi:hypothetical protein
LEKLKNKKIGIIDAEIIGKSKHRFPNLVCMKLSAYYKELGNSVKLLLSYDEIENYDNVFISKVFIKTEIPFEPEDKTLKKETTIVDYYKDNIFLKNPKIEFGGTGFYYEKSPKLPYEIEHHMPDYYLYDEWVDKCIKNGANQKEFVYYKDYSIGFLTRGCFRKCQFCVNKIYNKCEPQNSLNEFFDKDRKKLCFLDDNFFACSNWKDIINQVKATNKKFQFKQGLDGRLLNEDKIKEIGTWKYDGDFIFAFDNINDKNTIISKLDLLYKLNPNWNHQLKFYCFCGFDRNNKYNSDFWIKDIYDLFERIFILSKYSAFPYIMRHENYKTSPYFKIYNLIASWCNQPSLFKTFDFDLFCKCRGMCQKGYKEYHRNIEEYLKKYKKYSAWNDYEKFMKLTKNEFEDYVHILPTSISKFGNWVK